MKQLNCTEANLEFNILYHCNKGKEGNIQQGNDTGGIGEEERKEVGPTQKKRGKERRYKKRVEQSRRL